MFRSKKYLLILMLCFSFACSLGKPQNPQIALVDDRVIDMEAFHAQSAFMGLGIDPTALTQDLRLQVLELLIERELLLNQAQQLKLTLNSNEQDRYESMVRQGLEDDLFERKLIEQGISYEQWREMLRQQLLARKTLDMLLTSRIGNISPEQVKNYFEEHKEEFVQPEQVLAQHAVFPTRAMAQQIADLMRNGQDLRQAALEALVPLENETEPTWLTRGLVPKPMENTIFALQPGKVAGPVTSEYGFHVVRVLAKRPAAAADLANAAEEIQRTLTMRAKEEMSVILIQELRRQAKVWQDTRFIATGIAE
jgi:parvulin-like peptidyl-prolyl isomerase